MIPVRFIEIYGGHTGIGTDFYPGTSVFPVSIIARIFNTHLHINTVLMERTSGRKPGTLTKVILDMEGTLSGDTEPECCHV